MMNWSDIQQWIPPITLVLVYGLLLIESIPKVVVALLGASVVLLTQVVSQEEAFQSIEFNVIFLLVGMMILVNILNHTGGIKFLAIYTAQKCRGNGLKLLILLATLTAVLSALLDNVTTVVLVGAVTCSVSRRLGISPVPFLIAETLASNIGGTATLIGDPPNIMIGSAAKLSFNDFLVNLSPVVILIYLATLGIFAVWFGPQVRLPFAARRKLVGLTTDGVITHPKLLWASCIVMGLVIMGFLTHSMTHLEAATIAIAGASVLMIFENKRHIWDDVEWTTVFFFIGLFILVGAVEKVGVIDRLADGLLNATQGNYDLMAYGLLWLSGIASALIDNIPYTATMIPMVERVGAHYENIEPLWWSLALGTCLGGNGTLIGASANVLAADLAERNHHKIYFRDFLKIGGLVTLVSLALSTLYIGVRYL